MGSICLAGRRDGTGEGRKGRNDDLVLTVIGFTEDFHCCFCVDCLNGLLVPTDMEI